MSIPQPIQAAIARVDEIMSIVGVPGLSFAIIKDGETLGTFHRGFRDVARQLPPNDQTRWNINSLSKAFVAAMAGITVHEGAGELNWEAPIRKWLPELETLSDFITREVSLVDLMSHRWGAGDMNHVWSGADNMVLVQRKDFVKLASVSELLAPFRASWRYNNIGWELAGQVIEKAQGGKDLETLFREKIWAPLNMTRTTFHWQSDDDNQATSYGVYGDRSIVEIKRPFWQEGFAMSTAGGVKASLEDLLVWYKTTMRSIMDQFENETYETEGSPLKHMRMIASQHSILPGKTLREDGYGLGWLRSQLPCVVGTGMTAPLPGKPLIVGRGSPSRFLLYHYGLMAGSRTVVMMVPELDTAVVVLQNALHKVDTANLIAQMLLEAVLEVGEPNDYVQLTRDLFAGTEDQLASVRRRLEDERVPGTKPRDLGSYVGLFCDDANLVCMDIRIESGQDDGEGITATRLNDARFDGQTFKLNHYHNDTFTWIMSDKELAERAILGENVNYWKLIFAPGDGSDDGSLDEIGWLGGERDWTVMRRVAADKPGSNSGHMPDDAWGAILPSVRAFLVLGGMLMWAIARRMKRMPTRRRAESEKEPEQDNLDRSDARSIE